MKEKESLKVFILECVRNHSLSKDSAFVLLKSLGGSEAVSIEQVEYVLDAVDIATDELIKVREFWITLTEKSKRDTYRSRRRLKGSGPEVKMIAHGPMGSNCYIATSKGEGVIIDPGSSFDKIWPTVKRTEADIKYIIITHGHFDHMGSMEELKEATGAQIVLHRHDQPALSQSVLNGSFLFSAIKTFKPVDIMVSGGERFEVGGQVYEIIHTPGHTIGSICIQVNQLLFSGDMLFTDSDEHVGPITGNPFELKQSYQELCSRMREGYLVYPGHGAPIWMSDDIRTKYEAVSQVYQREGSL